MKDRVAVATREARKAEADSRDAGDQITTLQEEIRAQVAEAELLRSEKGKLSKDIVTQESEVEALSSQLRIHYAQHRVQAKQMNDLRKENNRLTANFNLLVKRNNELENQVKNLGGSGSRVKTLEEENEELKGQVANLETELKKSLEKFSDYKKRVRAMGNEF